jgi:hypothetical protein
MRRWAQHIIGRGWYGLWALMMALLVVGAVHTSPAAHADPSNGSMHVVVPVPSSDGKTVQGPVGAYVSVSASQATAGATYNLGWSNVTDGCASVFNPFTNGTLSVTADSSGSFTATFVWPDAAGTPGTLYLICASDTANPTTDVITADQQFQVLGANAPHVTLAQAPSSTHPGKVYAAGGPVQVKGRGFFPQGTAVAIFVTPSANFSPSDYQPDNALKTEDGSSILSDGQGQFTTIVLLPSTITGQLFLHAVSTDAVTNSQPPFPPSLVATSVIQIGPPVATPTVAPSPTPSQSTGPAGTQDDTPRIVAIAGLGILSLVLFIIGGILVVSAAAGTGKPPTPDGGTRSHSAVRTGQQW